MDGCYGPKKLPSEFQPRLIASSKFMKVSSETENDTFTPWLEVKHPVGPNEMPFFGGGAGKSWGNQKIYS